jgi:CPA2 family monovalent cation:H+ antiporter-2
LTAPFVYGLAGSFYTALARFRFFRSRMTTGTMTYESDEQEFHPQVLVLGGGRVGRYTSEALQSKGVSHLLIDFDSEAIDRAKRRKVPVLYGDATSPTVLEMGHPERAALAVVALPEAAITAIAVKALRTLAPDLHIVARVRRGEDIPRMREAGASGVVHGEFEAGAEMIRQSFDCLKIDSSETERYVDEIRLFRYRGGE